MFSLPDTVIVSNKEYRIRTDFRSVLEIFVMLDDPDLTDADKTEALLRMFYIDRPHDPEEALKAFSAFCDPRSSAHTNSKSPVRLIDWSQDFPLMVAPVNHILGCECRALPELHWHSFLAAYLEIPPESVFARVLRIREKLHTGKKLEKYERSWYRRNMDLVNLQPRYSSLEQVLLREWT